MFAPALISQPNTLARATQGGGSPDSPTGLQAEAGDSAVELTWATTSDVTWSVYRSPTDDFESASPLADGLVSAEYNDESGTPGARYYYFVTASNGTGESNPSTSAGGRAYLTLPPGSTDGVVVPPGTWTLGTLFFGTTLSSNLYIASYQGLPYYWDAGWFDDVGSAPADDVSVIAGETINFQVFGGSSITIWNGEP